MKRHVLVKGDKDAVMERKVFNTERIISCLFIPPVNFAAQYSFSYDLWIPSPV